MNKLYRIAADGRYLGFIVQDQPIENYAGRADLTPDQPPDAPIGYQAYRSNGAWTLQQEQTAAPTLEQLKSAKWAQMKDARRAAIRAPLVTPYGTFDADDAARLNIAQTAQFAQTAAQTISPGATPAIDFTRYDNTIVTLTAQQMIEVALALANQVQGAYARGRAVRAAIYAATTAAAVEAVTW
jgi:hypothetical protein